MTVENYEKYFSELKIFWYFIGLSFIGTLCLGLFSDIPWDVSIVMFIFVGLGISIFASIISMTVYDHLVEKRVEHDRQYLLPDIKLRYEDFDDNCEWTRVFRNKRYGKYDTNKHEDVNLIDRKGRYLLNEWCYFLPEFDIPYDEKTGKGGERLYVMHYKDGGLNLIYCHGIDKKRAEIVFDEPVKEFGDLSKKYIKVVFMDESVNYVNLNGGDIMFEENLPGGYDRTKN